MLKMKYSAEYMGSSIGDSQGRAVKTTPGFNQRF